MCRQHVEESEGIMWLSGASDSGTSLLLEGAKGVGRKQLLSGRKRGREGRVTRA